MINFNEFYLDTFRAARNFILPYLTDYKKFSERLALRVDGVDRGNNIQYSFDVELDRIIKDKIREYGLEGRIFSEESRLYTLGEKNEYRVIFDPFCNSTLASRGFLDGACGISVFSWDYTLLASGVLDYQLGVFALVEGTQPTKFFDVVYGMQMSAEKDDVEKVEESWVAIALENERERIRSSEVKDIFEKSKRLVVGSGHIYWFRLAFGKIDAYLDPIGGEPLYEMFAASVAQGAGCRVTDRDGEVFDAGKYLKIFEEDLEYRYYPVAASNEILHQDILKASKRV
ncbi:MAG: hypothetical protein IPJ67_03805 [Candidatus Moraniibacteriota bacterium]|nr:MAG: hypothetical protein IPJ67_03805 [Candidatus Moranbacteria bacterium]